MIKAGVSRRAVIALAVSGAVMPLRAHAVGMDFDESAFTAAQVAGKTILVEITASWCPVCARQRPIIDALLRTDEFRDALLFVVDYDLDREVLQRFRVTRQATLIVFKGAQERARSTGDATTASIRALFQRGL
jgi:thioredoxin 1